MASQSYAPPDLTSNDGGVCFSVCYVFDPQTYASYGVTGEKARYCAKHKGINMVNLTVKHCEFQGCVTQPSFNYSGQRKARQAKN